MLNKIRNRCLLTRLFFKLLQEKKYLSLLKYNKDLQNKLKLSIDDYKNYNQIIIEVIPIEDLKVNDEENILKKMKK